MYSVYDIWQTWILFNIQLKNRSTFSNELDLAEGDQPSKCLKENGHAQALEFRPGCYEFMQFW